MARWEQEALPSSFSARGGEKHEVRNPPEENKLPLQGGNGEITVAAGSSHQVLIGCSPRSVTGVSHHADGAGRVKRECECTDVL